MIRVATAADTEIIKELIGLLLKESVYSKMFDGYVLSQNMIDLYTNPKTFNEKICVLTTDGGVIVTGIGVFDIIPWLYNDAPIKMARLAYIYVLPAFRGQGYRQELEEAFEFWGKNVGAQYLSQGISKDTDKVKVEMNNNGYMKFETIYMKEVS